MLQHHLITFQADDPVKDLTLPCPEVEDQDVALDPAGVVLRVGIEPDPVAVDGKICRRVSLVGPPGPLHLADADRACSKSCYGEGQDQECEGCLHAMAPFRKTRPGAVVQE